MGDSRENGEQLTEALKKLGITFAEVAKHTFHISTAYGTVVYYAKNSKWQYKGRTVTGTPLELVDWLKQKKLLA